MFVSASLHTGSFLSDALYFSSFHHCRILSSSVMIMRIPESRLSRSTFLIDETLKSLSTSLLFPWCAQSGGNCMFHYLSKCFLYTMSFIYQTHSISKTQRLLVGVLHLPYAYCVFQVPGKIKVTLSVFLKSHQKLIKSTYSFQVEFFTIGFMDHETKEFTFFFQYKFSVTVLHFQDDNFKAYVVLGRCFKCC